MRGRTDDRTPWLDRLFNESYRRRGKHYVHFWLTVSGVGIVFIPWPAQHLTQFPLWGRDESDLRLLLVFMGIGAVISTGVMVWAARFPFRPVIAFLRGEPAEPEAVWHGGVRVVPRVATVAVLAFCTVGNIPCVYLAGSRRGFTTSEYVGAWLAESLITVTAGFFFILIWEMAFRPLLRDVDPLLPEGFAPRPHWLTLTRRSAIATTSVMLYTGLAVSGVVAGFEGLDARLWATVTGSIASAVTFGGLITALVSHSIFSRVSDMKAALVRLGAGDFDVRVALRLGDELDAAGQALNATAARLKREDAALRESRARLTSVEHDERRRIERDLRVGVDHRLQSLAEQLALVADMVQDAPELSASCAEVRDSLEEARGEIKALANGIFPVLLVSDGLQDALEDAAERAGAPADIDVAGCDRLPHDIQAAIYFCCSEALQNVAKHAGPDARVQIRVLSRHGIVQFAVNDDGVGFADVDWGHGVANIRARLRALGGDVQISSVPGEGTSVTGWLTMNDAAALV